ncbi:hypothetical protein JW865_03385 [Candidatus Bathyarchaeota archaeon]|nr:hypothetical protein [Candidatus Bathyarchaeota archaeon]
MSKIKHKIALMGSGNIGKELLREIQNSEKYKFIAIGDSTGYIIQKNGFNKKEINKIIEFKNSGKRFITYSDDLYSDIEISKILKEYSIDTLIDVTASQTYPHLFKALNYSNVITSNKLPFSDTTYEKYAAIIRKSIKTGKVLDYGTTVGAGLRILKIINFIGIDGIQKFSGCLSGTMNYISQRLNESTKFSQAILEAMNPPRYYCEPDPRIDLSGEDFKRKIVIISRLLGKKISKENIFTDPLLKESDYKITKDEFIKKIYDFDEEIDLKIMKVKNDKQALWFLGSADLISDEYSLGFKKIDIKNPITRSRESDNTLTFQPNKWIRPVTIIGPGAGAIETVSGLLSCLNETVLQKR